MPPLSNYAVKAGVVCWQVKLCDPHLLTLPIFSAITIMDRVVVVLNWTCDLYT